MTCFKEDFDAKFNGAADRTCLPAGRFELFVSDDPEYGWEAWSHLRDLNPRPPVYDTDALPLS